MKQDFCCFNNSNTVNYKKYILENNIGDLRMPTEHFHNFDIDHYNNLFVIGQIIDEENSSYKLYKFDKQYNQIHAIDLEKEYERDLSVDTDGNVFVLENRDHNITIHKFDNDLNLITSFTQDLDFTLLHVFIRAENDWIYVLLKANDNLSIVVFDNDLNLINQNTFGYDKPFEIIHFYINPKSKIEYVNIIGRQLYDINCYNYFHCAFDDHLNITKSIYDQKYDLIQRFSSFSEAIEYYGRKYTEAKLKCYLVPQLTRNDVRKIKAGDFKEILQNNNNNLIKQQNIDIKDDHKDLHVDTCKFTAEYNGFVFICGEITFEDNKLEFLFETAINPYFVKKDSKIKVHIIQ